MGADTYLTIFGAADPLAAATHALGMVGAVVALVPLWRHGAGSRWRRFTALVFGGSMVLLFAASATYHVLPAGAARSVLQRIDHGAIYLLIAGTFTPIVGNLASRRMRSVVLGPLWALAAGGVVFKAAFFGVASDAVDVLLYLGMSWLGAVPFLPTLPSLGLPAVAWVVAAALLYTGGALCELFAWPPLVGGVLGHHEVFHVAVLAAAYCFYRFVMRYALRAPAAAHVQS